MKRVMLVLLLLVACAPVEVELNQTSNVSNIPEKIVEEKLVVQCWDNSTADSIDACPERPITKVIEEQVEAPEIPIAKKLLNEAQSKFKSYAYLLEDRLVIVSGNRARHLFLKLSQLPDRTPVTDVFVDLDKKEAVAYCNVEREAEILDDAFDWERSRCGEYLDKPFVASFADWNPKGPLDYLRDFSELEPILVENNVQTISIGGNSKTIQPSLHYMVDGKRVVLRIDKRYQVPLKIEVEGGKNIDFRDAYFDVMVVYGKQQKITDDWLVYKPVSDYWKAAASK